MSSATGRRGLPITLHSGRSSNNAMPETQGREWDVLKMTSRRYRGLSLDIIHRPFRPRGYVAAFLAMVRSDMTLLKTCAVMFVLALAPASAMAQGCLTPAEQRAAIAGNQAVPLDQATRNLRPEHRGEVVNARLCRVSTGQLVYLLTVVNRHGKVMRARFDAATGQLVQVR
jgi:hypothetical protein